MTQIDSYSGPTSDVWMRNMGSLMYSSWFLFHMGSLTCMIAWCENNHWLANMWTVVRFISSINTMLLAHLTESIGQLPLVFVKSCIVQESCLDFRESNHWCGRSPGYALVSKIRSKYQESVTTTLAYFKHTILRNPQYKWGKRFHRHLKIQCSQLCFNISWHLKASVCDLHSESIITIQGNIARTLKGKIETWCIINGSGWVSLHSHNDSRRFN